jgi:hypothetical protein
MSILCIPQGPRRLTCPPVAEMYREPPFGALLVKWQLDQARGSAAEREGAVLPVGRSMTLARGP